MPNVKIQDLTAIINGTSRYGAEFDTVHVETLLVTDEPIPQEMFWYVPSGTSVPKEVLDFFKINKLDMYPMTESKILQGTEDIRESAQANNLSDVENDAARFMLRAVMKKSTLTPVVGTTNCYIVSYDYKIYPVEPNNFEFKVVLPFDGLGIFPAGGRVQVTVTAPINSTINSVLTNGVDQNGSEVSAEVITPIQNTMRPIVSFEYHLDPIYTIRYTY